jgi:hypothetical protein
VVGLGRGADDGRAAGHGELGADDAWRRLVGYLIQAFAAEAAQPLPDPPTRTQMYRALLRLPKRPAR